MSDAVNGDARNASGAGAANVAGNQSQPSSAVIGISKVKVGLQLFVSCSKAPGRRHRVCLVESIFMLNFYSYANDNLSCAALLTL